MQITELHHERRLYERHAFREKIIFESEHGEPFFYVYSKDLSFGGMSLEADIPAAPGSLVMISCSLPNQVKSFRVTAEVMRAKPEDRFMALRFLGLSEEQQISLKALCEQSC